MSGKQTRKGHMPGQNKPHAESIAQHQQDAAYFRAHPGVQWRVRRLLPGEAPEAGTEMTHIIIVHNPKQGSWGATMMALTRDDGGDDGGDVPDDAVYHYAALTLARWWDLPYDLIYPLGGRTLVGPS